MKTLKNISFKNRLALSYSFILALMLISAAIFYHTSYHHLKKGLHSQTVSVLSSSVRQMDDLLKQIHTASCSFLPVLLLKPWQILRIWKRNPFLTPHGGFKSSLN